MDDGFDATVTTDRLARAAARADRLLPSRSGTATGIHLSAKDSRLWLSAADGETAVRAELAAAVAGDGEVAVSRRALATTLASVTAPEVRLRREGARLAIRTPSARYAIPLLDPAHTPHAAPAEAVPPVVGGVEAAHLRAAGLAIAGAASRDGLPIFTGIRVRGGSSGLSLAATDRFRMASATLPWISSGTAGVLDGSGDRSALGGSGSVDVLGGAGAVGVSGESGIVGALDGTDAVGVRGETGSVGVLGGSGVVDVLVPVGVFAEVVRQIPATGPAPLRFADGKIGFDWADGGIVAASLALPFPDGQIEALLRVNPVCSVQIEADELAAAVRRAVPFAGAAGHIQLEALDGMVVIRSADTDAGESREEVKADVSGDHVVVAYQGRYLADALRCFAGRRISVQVQQDIRPTLFAAAEPDAIGLRYLVVPLRLR